MAKDIDIINNFLLNSNSEFVTSGESFRHKKEIKYILINSIGYKVVTNKDNLLRGKSPYIFGKSNPYTVENIRIWMNKNNIPFNMISNEYYGSRGKLSFECRKHGSFTLSWEALQKGCRCERCTTERINADKKFDIEEVKENILSMGYTPLFDDYINCDEKLLILDKNEYKCLMSYYNLKRGQVPQPFKINNPFLYENINTKLSSENKDYRLITKEITNSNKSKLVFQYEDGCKGVLSLRAFVYGCTPEKYYKTNPYTIDNIKIFIKNINPSVNILSKKYIDNDSPLKFECENHGLFECAWVEFKQLVSCCRWCGIESRSGSNAYNYTGIDRDIVNVLRNFICGWKKDSMIQCSYKCVITKNRFDRVHHLYGFDSMIYEAFDETRINFRTNLAEYDEREIFALKNKILEIHYRYPLGVCLIEEIHDEFHKKYGYGKNTPSQFYEFYKDKTGREFLNDYPQYQNIKEINKKEVS